MTIIYSKPQSGNFPAAVVVDAVEDDGGLNRLAVRAESSMVTTVVRMTRQELLDMAQSIINCLGRNA